MTKGKKDTIKSGATLFNFHMFAMDRSRAMWIPIERDENGSPIKPFVIHATDLVCEVPQWQLTWGAGASMVMRKVQIPPFSGLLR